MDLILAEDTRRSRVLLNHFNIESELASYHDHTPPARTRAILQRLAAGAAMALISDAGTPAVSDPGYRLIDGAHNLDVAVRAVPGPCAAAAALSVCGLPIERFVFEGFLPARAASRRRRLQALRAETRTMLFFETPHRLSACLDDMVDIFGPGRQATLVREISKHHETARRGELSQLRAQVAADADQRRGEIALLVAADVEAAPADDGLLLRLLLEELPPAKAAALAARFHNRPKRGLYEEAMRLASVDKCGGDAL